MKYILLTILILISLASLSSAKTDAQLTIPESDIIFSHRFHVEEQEVECLACHVDIESSTAANDRNLPTMDECGSCHDVEDDETCGMCHKDAEEPMELENPIRELIFAHQKHIDMNTGCAVCHGNIPTSEQSDILNLPKMSLCFDCHDGDKAKKECVVCHSSNLTLADIHPADWRHQHGDRANTDSNYCNGCHKQESFCLDCHRGDNLLGNIHELNYQFTHGLDAKSKKADCRRCHNQKEFCVSCHEGDRRMPLGHSKLSWLNDHGRAAFDDVENCASCHNTDDPTCARAGCHNDFDGIKGTNPKIHSKDPGQFDNHGPWHDDGSFYCFDCHRNSQTTKIGFCGYCHK